MTDVSAAVLAVGTNTAAQYIQALPKTAPTMAPRARPFNLATLDAKGVPTAITVSVIAGRCPNYPTQYKGNQSDKTDARRLDEPLRLNQLHPVYHGEHGLRNLKEQVRSYLTIRSRTGHDARGGHLFPARPR